MVDNAVVNITALLPHLMGIFLPFREIPRRAIAGS